MPIVSLKFRQEKPYIFQKNKQFYPSDENTPKRTLIDAMHYCVGISNSGKSRLFNCEGVLISIWSHQNNKYIKLTSKPQIVLKWFEGEFRKDTIDINPGREERLVLFFIPSSVRNPSFSNIKLTLYHSSDIINEMEELGYGEYIFHLKIFSSNADNKSFFFRIIFSKGHQEKDRWFPICDMQLLDKPPKGLL